MSSAKWRNAIIILLLLAGLVYAVEFIMKFFLPATEVSNFGIQKIKDDLISIFRVFELAALAGAIILFPVWIYKYIRERRGGGGSEKNKGGDGSYSGFPKGKPTKSAKIKNQPSREEYAELESDETNESDGEDDILREAKD